ncbi:MAG: hypothetical protein HOF21_13870 [Nitrospina sp.]|nr:hypothetical protein [Nitrospina sp.]MBT4899984.1 hypothetical protein [Nitrospina sp.]
MKTGAAKFGSTMYFIWGLLHLKAAFLVYQLGATLEAGMVQGRVFQDAWSLLLFALAGMIVAVKFNWENDRLGYWINLIIVSATDIGFIVFMLVPGHLPIFPGILGPVFWVLGAAFSTFGRLANQNNKSV